MMYSSIATRIISMASLMYVIALLFDASLIPAWLSSSILISWFCILLVDSLLGVILWNFPSGNFGKLMIVSSLRSIKYDSNSQLTFASTHYILMFLLYVPLAIWVYSLGFVISAIVIVSVLIIQQVQISVLNIMIYNSRAYLEE